MQSSLQNWQMQWCMFSTNVMTTCTLSGILHRRLHRRALLWQQQRAQMPLSHMLDCLCNAPERLPSICDTALCMLQTAATTAKVGDAMAKANAAMAAMGATNDPKKVAQTMQEFQKESAKMDMGQEMMDDTLDGVFDDDEVEGETDDLMNQASLLLIPLGLTHSLAIEHKLQCLAFVS